MADQKTIENKAADAVETVKDTAEAAFAKAAEAAVEPVRAAKKAVAKPVRKVRATATKRRARKAPAKVVKAVKKTNQRAARAAKRVAKPAAAAAAAQIERTTNMTYDFTKLFSAPELPGTEQMTKFVNEANERGQDMVRRSRKAAEDMAEIARANAEALAEAGKIAAKGARSLSEDMLSSGREGFEQAQNAVKTLTDAKSPTEFIQLQSEMARASFDRMVSESSKFAEAFVKLAGEAVQPLSTRATLNAERLGEIAA